MPTPQIFIDTYLSPCGPLLLGSMGESLVLCAWTDESGAWRHRRAFDRLLRPTYVRAASDVTREAARQLDEYFEGRRRTFTLPLRPVGTPFQRSVWQTLATIAYGTTVTYAQEAVTLGRPSAVRAVAAANGANPLSIFLPCHRVVGARHSLTGYAGGLAAKRFLLDLERATWPSDIS